MNAEIVAVGTEILLGDIVNGHAQFLSRQLAEIGVDVFHHVSVGDNLPRLVEALRVAAGRADVVITTGGLGPTADDITRQGVSEALGLPLVFDSKAEEAIAAFFAARKLPMASSNRRQAMKPEGAELLPNPNGTAPGLWASQRETVVVSLPGPARELQPMFLSFVKERLARMTGVTIQSRRLHFVGIGESALEERIKDLLHLSQPTVAPYAKWGEVEVRVTAKAKDQAEAEAWLKPVVEEICKRAEPYFYGEGDVRLEEAVVGCLGHTQRSIAVAESVTGGWITQRLTSVPGASKVLRGGEVVYTEEAKKARLHVPDALLEASGAVSAEVTRVLAESVRQAYGADLGLAATGWAGPDSDGPVGEAFVALADGRLCDVAELHLSGSREDIRHRICQEALRMVWRSQRQGG